MPDPKWFDKPGFIVSVELIYLFVLFIIALVYLTGLRSVLSFTPPDSFGPIAVGVPWFGALGGVIISLAGTVDHRKDWDPSMKYWHITRPFVGVVLAIIAVLIFQVGILSVTSSPPSSPGLAAPQNLLYYLIAFVIGYREQTFRELIKRLADVILTPGGGASAPVIGRLNPLTGGVAGGDKVTITGSSFTGTTSVKFGPKLAPSFQVDSDGQISTMS